MKVIRILFEKLRFFFSVGTGIFKSNRYIITGVDLSKNIFHVRDTDKRSRTVFSFSQNRTLKLQTFALLLCCLTSGCFLLKKGAPSYEKRLTVDPVVDKNGYSPGHILIVPMGGAGKFGLYNKNGYFEKSWSTPHITVYGELIDKNSILMIHRHKKFFDDPDYLMVNTGLIAVYDMEGNLKTEFEDIHLHHDISIKNPSRIFALSLRIRNMKHKNKIVRVADDAIIEIDLKTKKVVKQWLLSDYLPLPDSLPKPSKLYGDSIDIYHTNTIDYIAENPLNGNEAVLITMRNFHKGMIALIDLKTNKLLYKSPKGFLLFPHDGKFTKDKTITVFDNGGKQRLNSRIFEMDIRTNKIVWEYDEIGDLNALMKRWGVSAIKNNLDVSNPIMREWIRWKHFSPYISGAQKTERGYLITSGMQGRIFEVSKDHKIVWDLPSAAVVFRSATGGVAMEIFKARQYNFNSSPHNGK